MEGVNLELADFLRRARDSVDPARAGLADDGRPRRVPGLRREEVALLAGVSADYYTRLEQGRRIVPSWAVLDALARALDLDEAGRAHLGMLVGSTTEARVRRAPRGQTVRPGMLQLLASLHETPAIILGRRTDILATNRLARVLMANFDRMEPRERNYARWMFLSAQARELFLDWDVQARAVVENLRLDFASYPEDGAARRLVEELRTVSPDFREWWDAHRVYQRTFGTKHLRHPLVGDLTVHYETLTLPGDRDQTLFLYATEPASASRRAMERLIASSTRSGHDHARPAEPASSEE